VDWKAARESAQELVDNSVVIGGWRENLGHAFLALDAALRKYGRHEDGCACLGPFPWLEEQLAKGNLPAYVLPACTCGFMEALGGPALIDNAKRGA
jgi:hypothetical protein